jgi:uncharacterized protein
LNTEAVTIDSGGLSLKGVVHTPTDVPAGEQRPGFVVLHGFDSHHRADDSTGPARLLGAAGYVVLCLDFRGCGDSDGEPGRIICQDQVADAGCALGYLASRADVAEEGVSLIGTGLGAAVAIYCAGVDPRVAAVISCGGWGDGERELRRYHPSPEAWARFTSMLVIGQAHQRRNGESLMVARDDIAPVPWYVESDQKDNEPKAYPVETAQSLYDFCADEVVQAVAPRPLLLLHADEDQITSPTQSLELFRRSGSPTELHVLTDVDSLLCADSNPRGQEVIRSWLARYCPLSA